jgi:hypothetical protein
MWKRAKYRHDLEINWLAPGSLDGIYLRNKNKLLSLIMRKERDEERHRGTRQPGGVILE